jgi:hypothetical protein
MKRLPLICCVLALASSNSMAGGNEPVRVEPVEGSEFPRLVFEQKAVERIGLKVFSAMPEPIAKRRIIAAEVTTRPTDATSAEQLLEAQLWVQLLPSFDTDKIDLDQPSRVLSIAANESFEPIPVKALQSAHAEQPILFYATDSRDSSHLPKRVLVEVQNKSLMLTRVPTSATLYDPAGASFVYVETAPLTYRRFPIHIADVDQDFAYLDQGPPAGSNIVEVGAPLLLGIEFKIGH